jgi:hypothetical protein
VLAQTETRVTWTGTIREVFEPLGWKIEPLATDRHAAGRDDFRAAAPRSGHLGATPISFTDAGAGSLQRLDPRRVAVDHEEHSGALRDRPDELAGQAEDGRLVRGAVSNDEGSAAIAQAVEHPPQRGSQGRRVLLDELRVGRPQSRELTLPASR